jgi:hypothetical protein
MLRKISITLVASAVSLLLAGGIASAANQYTDPDTESGEPFVNYSPEEGSPVGATGIRPREYVDTESGTPPANLMPELVPGTVGEPTVICPSVPEQDCRD